MNCTKAGGYILKNSVAPFSGTSATNYIPGWSLCGLKVFSETQHIFHAENTALPFNKFRCHNRASGKAHAVVRNVRDLNIINRRTVFYLVCPGSRIDPFANDLQFSGVITDVVYPFFLFISSRICSASVMAVPLGASFFWV